MAGFGANDQVVSPAPDLQPFGTNDQVVSPAPQANDNGAPSSGFGVNDKVVASPTFATPFKAFARGVGEGAGAVVSGLGVAQSSLQADTEKILNDIDAGKPVDLGSIPPYAFVGVNQYKRATPTQRPALRQQILGSFFGQQAQQVGRSVTQATQGAIPLTPGEQTSWWTKVPEVIGQAIPAIGAAATTKIVGPTIALGGAGAVMAAQGAQQGFQDAIQHGANLDTAYKSAIGSAEIQGGLGIIPVGGALERLNIATGGMFGRILNNAWKTGGTQAAISAVQQTLNNLQARNLYDPQRGIGDNVADAALQGAVLGTATGAALGVLPGGGHAESPPPPAPTRPELPLARTPGAVPPPLGEPPMQSPVAIERLFGKPVGLVNPDGTVTRIVPEAIQSGNVFYRNEDGSVRGSPIAQFQRDLAPAPVAKTENATTVPLTPREAGVEEPPIAVQDEFFNRPSVVPDERPIGVDDAATIAAQRAAAERASPAVVPTEPMGPKPPPPETGPQMEMRLPQADRIAAVEREVDAAAERARQTQPAVKPFQPTEPVSADRLAVSVAAAKPVIDEPGRYGDVVDTPDDPNASIRAKLAALTIERNAARDAAGVPHDDQLWRLPKEQLDDLRSQSQNYDANALENIFGPGGAKRYDSLDRSQNSSNSDRADKATNDLNAMVDALPPDKSAAYDSWQRVAPMPSTEVIDILRSAHEEYTPGEPVENIARDAAYALRGTSAREILAVPQGGQSIAAQAAYIRLVNGMRAMAERGVTANEMPGRLYGGLLAQGFKEGDAADFVGSFIEQAKGKFGGIRPAERGEVVPERQALLAPKPKQIAAPAKPERPKPTGAVAQQQLAAANEILQGREFNVLTGAEKDEVARRVNSSGSDARTMQRLNAIGYKPDARVQGPPEPAAQAVAEGKTIAEPRNPIQEFWKDDEGALRFGRSLRTARETPDAIAAKAARLGREAGSRESNDLNLANAFMTMPAALASRHSGSARYFNELLNQHRTAETKENEAVPQVAPYLALDNAAQARVDKILEYARLYGHDLTDDGRDIVIRMPETRTPSGAPFPTLSRPGEIVALDARETAAFHSLRNFFQTRLQEIGQAIARETGYDGAFNEQALRNAIGSNSASAAERAAAGRALTIWQETIGSGRKGYVPLARYGQYYIKVMPHPVEVPGRDATPASLADGHFEFVPVSYLDKTVSGNKGASALRSRIAELRRQFPADRYTLTSDPVQDLKTLTDTINIPAIERIIMRMDKGDEAAKAVDAVLAHVAEQRRAGFRKESQNISGYSTDFPRAIVDYVRHTSSMIARLQHRKGVDSAYNAVQQGGGGVAQYWKDHKNYMESNGYDFGALRKIAFYQYLWGSPSGAIVNLSQTALVTAPTMGAWAGLRTLPLIGDALGEATRAIRVDQHGIGIDWSKLGRTPAERAFVDEMVKNGQFNPVLAREFEGTRQRMDGLLAAKNLRPYSQKLGQIWEIGSSAFNTAEQINRVAVGLPTFRATQNPQLMARLVKMYANDPRFVDLMNQRNPDGSRGMTPTKAAQWMVDETQFIGGKLNRAPMQRSVGGLALQMRSYQLNTLRVMYKNMTRLGYQGQIAAALMGGALIATSGLMGLPFAEDADKAAQTASKALDWVDPMAEMRLRQFIYDESMSRLGVSAKTAQWLGEAAARGVLRPSGVDIGPRVGMGNVVPDGTIWSVVPVLSATVERSQQFWQAVKNGEPLGAAAQVAGALAGKPGQDIASAVALPYEGKRTQAGDIVVPPSQITPAEIGERALGLNSTRFARATEQRYQQTRLNAATQAEASNMLRTAAAHYALAQDAATTGDTARAQGEMAEFNHILAKNADRLNDPNIPMWQQIPTPARMAMRSAIERQMNFNQSMMAKTNKFKRPQMGAVQQLFGP